MRNANSLNPLRDAPFDAVIAGGGFAGLALALSLARGLGSGCRLALISPDVIDARANDRDVRATALSAASVRMLDALGVWPACRDSAQAVTGIDITDSSLNDGVRPVLLSYDNTIGTREPATHILPNAVLDRALAGVVYQTAGIAVITGGRVAAFQSGAETVAVSLDTGQAFTARLLVAADGRRSRLRDLADIKTVGWGYRQTGIVTTIAHDRPHGGRAAQHFLPGGPFAMLPLPGNRCCITWSEGEIDARRILALDDTGFLAEIDRRVGGRLGTLTLDGPRQSWPLEVMMARSFVARRFALVGDAAHNVHPIAGQGLNLGLKDVAALAEAIVDTHRLGLDIGSDAVLARYERWRRFDTLTAAAGFDALNRLFSRDGAFLRAFRDFGLGIVDRLPGIKGLLVAEAAGTTGTLPRLLKGDAI
jgi:2-octaprenyl-6-methoxyphenol hydroxylase